VHLDLQPCPIDIWIDQAMQYFSAQAIRRGIRFEKVLTPDLPVVDGDLEKLTQVVGNLLSNAFKFTPDGGRIHIEADHIDDVLQLRVTDEGPGIPREFQDRLFERFFQVDGSTTRAHGGTGLGLAIAAHIVHLHHGEIRLESEPGAGATFIVELPVSPAIAKLEGLVSPPEVVATKP
jgi:signal transduction histidine kinase